MRIIYIWMLAIGAALTTADDTDQEKECPGADKPKAVKNASVKCIAAGGCRLSCKSRYLFPGGEKTAYFICENNQWTIDYNKYTECRAQCKPPCANGGTCINPRTCDCTDTGYQGKKCKQKVICDPVCLNNGLCIHNICVCETGYSGEQCEVNSKLTCETLSCGENAFCEEEGGNGSPVCTCKAGFHRNPNDSTCQDNNECESNAGLSDCDHSCHNSEGSYSCSCREGFTLNEDKKTCQDNNECESNAGLGDCDHSCHNSEGSYNCSCTEGFTPRADDKTCQAESRKHQKSQNLVWSQIWNLGAKLVLKLYAL